MANKVVTSPQSSAGFTIVELLFVIGIFAILMSVVFVVFNATPL